MRNETGIKNLIIDFAKHDDRVNAVLLNGSRANPNIKPDQLQDFDIVFLVDKLESFTKDNSWTNIFGETIIFQLPDGRINRTGVTKAQNLLLNRLKIKAMSLIRVYKSNTILNKRNGSTSSSTC
jgi:hypothetical protein